MSALLFYLLFDFLLLPFFLVLVGFFLLLPSGEADCCKKKLHWRRL